VGRYSLREVARILGVPAARLRYWERTALVTPDVEGAAGASRVADAERGARAADRGRASADSGFGFRELRSAKAVRDLLARGVPLARIRRSAEEVRRTHPELEAPLPALRVWMEDSGRVVVRHGDALLEPDGQAVLDFAGEARGGGGSAVAPLAGPAEHGELRPDALAWFEQGCLLDEDPTTWDRAAEAYEKALELAPDFADALCNLGSVELYRDRRAKGRRCFERALALEPDHPEANCNLAILLEEEGRLAEALAHYERALAGEPASADVHASIALVCEKLGRPDRARAFWLRYLRLEPAGSWSDLARERLGG